MRIDHELLNAGPSRWGNLGCWSEGDASYPAACRALARRLGEAAQLGPGQRVLDCGVGAGEQLSEWVSGFGVAEVVALDLLSENVRAARERVRAAGIAAQVRLLEGSATALEALGLGGGFDAVLALDCAYHFAPREAFLRQAAAQARPGARLVLSDALLGAARAPRALRLAARLCAVPPSNLWDEARYRRELRAAGWRALSVESLDAEVLGGFSAFALRHLPGAALRRPWGGWPKVLATALGCRWAARSGRVHYAVVVAEREGEA